MFNVQCDVSGVFVCIFESEDSNVGKGLCAKIGKGALVLFTRRDGRLIRKRDRNIRFPK